jgi:hypothetical protein
MQYIPTANGDGTISLRAAPDPGWRERLRRLLQRIRNTKS